MYRHGILRELELYRSRWIEESKVVDRFIAFVRDNGDCFKRELIPGHVTGSAWIVNAAGTEILLTHHKKLNRWLQLGGHADGDTDVLAVALREAREESGLDGIEIFSREIFDIDIHRIPPRGKDPEHDHYDVRYVFRQLGRDAYTVSEESHDLAWVEIDGLERYTEEVSMLRMAEKWRLCLAERDTKSGM